MFKTLKYFIYMSKCLKKSKFFYILLNIQIYTNYIIMSISNRKPCNILEKNSIEQQSHGISIELIARCEKCQRTERVFESFFSVVEH